jgi:UDP-N-acetylmuramoyl-tripeptide--D-alanyl-D-alanine ligase
MIWTTQELSKALSLSIAGNKEFGTVQFNSKDIEQGDIFIALKGKRDGHEFVEDALKRGAGAAIVSKEVIGVDQAKLILVDDTYEALMDLAEFKRRNSKAKFITITGSVGKTSTKEATKIMLSAYGKTHASHGNFNNYIGVPLCLASMPNDTQYAVIEMGMSSKGELSELSKLAIPDIALITAISEGHIESFNSVKEIADAKCEIFEGMDINEGIAIVNRDITTYERCLQNIDRAGMQNVQTFGKKVDSGVRFVSSEILEDDTLRLSYSIDGEELELVIPLIPIHLAENFAAAFAVVKALKLDPEAASAAISSFVPLIGRGGLLNVKNGKKEYKIICDYYNANPQSMKAALEYLSLFDNENKVAILGDMGGLGKFTRELHMSIVPQIKDSGVKKLFLVGESMKQLKEEFDKDVEVFCFDDAELLGAEIDKYIIGGELILIKGSRSIGLERVATKLGVKNAL